MAFRSWAIPSLIVLMVAGLAMLANSSSMPSQSPQQVQAASGTNDSQSRLATSTVVALKGTSPLALPVAQDILEQQRQQIIHYFLSLIAASPAKRDKLWKPNFSSIHAYDSSVQIHRNHLGKMLGLIQPRLGTPQVKVLQADGNIRIEDVSIPIAKDFEAQALVFLPRSGGHNSAVIAIPPANESAEKFTGLVQGMAPASWLMMLLRHDVVVAVPDMVERIKDHPLCQKAGGKDRRHILWRAGFIVGRTLVGIGVQQVLAVQAFLASQQRIDTRRIAVFGERQGGMTALYAAATDKRLAGAAIVDYFQQREDCWKEPVDRVVYGQLNEFGDAEVAALIAPRPLITITSSNGPLSFGSVKVEIERAARFYQGLRASDKLVSIRVRDNALDTAVLKLAADLGATRAVSPPSITLRLPLEQVEKSRNEHFVMLYHYLRGLDAASDQVRQDYWHLDSTPPQDRARKVAALRASLSHLMGVIPSETIPMNPRTALIGETDKFLAYDVFLDVVPGVQAYGQLLVPRAVAGHMNKRLPAMICQHGFDGAPKYVTGVGTDLESNDHFYHRFGERLAERGYVVFAPYLTVPADHQPPAFVHRADLINPIVRMAACMGMMRTSIELAKLHRIVDFLQSLSFVNPHRIGYYGLSYGGYSAMWMPPLEPRLRFTIISGYFNDRREDLTSVSHCVYWCLPDEDFYNWNLLNRFPDLELIAAMWPRPVCIEWGLYDPTTTPAWHRKAWQGVKKFADAWGMDDQIVSDDFIGHHTIHGIQTFFFIDRWLRPERSAGRDYGCRDYTYCYETVAPDFYGYSLSSMKVKPHVTQLLGSSHNSVIRGKFYVSDISTMFTGMAFKTARIGHPGDLIVRFGSREGADDLGQARILAKDVYPNLDLWYAAQLKKPVRLDPKEIYFFEINAESGRAPENCYKIFGPKPLGGKDYPSNFSLSFQVLTTKRK